ncbi:MAG: ribonuclease PH [Chloroflexi bacterium]|nr:ribonuclease PH [Chloroflexota bacterium]MBC79130.1 ribonuclease PH [Chloroflexota bacterium]MBK90529.1 ribonuclease PH [Chloroflexota bacterium]|tara:strand:- start:12836 stop:13555 length:720 start_codon:yes stop_codon:yes gene_type:complete
MRKNNRKHDEARNLSIVPNYQKNSIGSVLIKFEDTQVICSTNISNNLPRWLMNKNQGWVTAEYNMLPNSSSERISRDRGNKLSGRTQEIQRLIGRSLRQAIDLTMIPGVIVTIDCDVLNADGGTRTASITGSYISTYIALKNYYNTNPSKFFKNQIAAISLGKVDGEIYLDLDYSEDSIADFDMNLILNSKLEIIEIQGTSENELLSFEELNQLIQIGSNGIKNILDKQNEIIKSIDLN